MGFSPEGRKGSDTAEMTENVRMHSTLMKLLRKTGLPRPKMLQSPQNLDGRAKTE